MTIQEIVKEPLTAMEKCKKILDIHGIDAAVIYLCIKCNLPPVEAKEIVYDLI